MMSINVIRENDATSHIKAIYEDIKQSLQLPWTPAIFQAFAVYPRFLQFAWGQLKPSTTTEQFRIDSDRARSIAETVVSQAHRAVYKHEDALRNNLSVRDLTGIQAKLEAFTYGNPKLLLISTALYRGVDGSTVGGNGDPADSHDNFGSRVIQKIEINPIEEDEAPLNVKAIYQDIKATLNTNLINTDYKTVANWPGFLALAWDEIKQYLDWPFYAEDQEMLISYAYQAADRLAYPLKIGRNEMGAAGVHEEDFKAIEDMIKLFAELIPGLNLNVIKMRLIAEDLLEIDRGAYAA